jgi:leucyl-tRNA synthetase
MKKNNSSSTRASQKTSPATSQKPAAYHHQKIEKKWQKMWDEQQLYKTLSAREARKKKMKPYYVLDMFPYPSGAGLHVGHPRGYIASDIFARMKRMQGYNVLHPMGFDSFGLPAEQYAIQTGKNPATFTQQLVKRYREQLSQLGFSYDWDRQVATHDPEYYQWTQWIFLQIYNSWYDRSKQKARPLADLEKEFARKGNSNINAVCDENTPIFSQADWKQFSDLEKQNILMKYRLAYEGYAEVNWCAELGTVLANDEIIEVGGKMVSERGEFPVVKKPMRQWFMRITAYADRLIEGLDTIDWSHSIKEIQRNWIGKSEGSEIEFKISTDSLQNPSLTLPQEMGCKVFTTRADTLFGVTYVVLAPEHPLVAELKSQITNWNKVEKYITSVKSKSDEDRVAAKEKTGICLEGIYAINPANEEQVPVWIADYVLAGYGTGAVMAVPAHDERDFEFAQKYDLSIKHVVTDNLNINYTEEESLFCNLKEGWLINSGKFDGFTSDEARKAITEFVGGKLVTKYKMRDAIFARQRYWGEPIPLVHTQEGIIKTVSEKQLPLKLPPVKSYAPSGNGEGPLATVKSWVTAGYETNTMPGWAGSSWYFLRYIDPKNKKSFASQDELDYWFSSQKKTKGASSQGAVNMYVGGSEHATGHLLFLFLTFF